MCIFIFVDRHRCKSHNLRESNYGSQASVQSQLARGFIAIFSTRGRGIRVNHRSQRYEPVLGTAATEKAHASAPASSSAVCRTDPSRVRRVGKPLSLSSCFQKKYHRIDPLSPFSFASSSNKQKIQQSYKTNTFCQLDPNHFLLPSFGKLSFFVLPPQIFEREVIRNHFCKFISFY